MTSDKHVGKATYVQSQRYRRTSAVKMGEWHTASHVERQPKAKKPAETPPPPKP